MVQTRSSLPSHAWHAVIKLSKMVELRIFGLIGIEMGKIL
jgi:hypothetical protein